MRDTAAILSFFAVCMLHELGHLTAIYMLDGSIRSVELTGTGIRILSDPPSNSRDGSIILLSGPAVNIAVYLLCVSAGWNGYFAQLSLAEGVFNLLPFSFLDGGALIEQYITGTEHERQLRAVMSTAQVLTIAAGVYFCIRA